MLAFPYFADFSRLMRARRRLIPVAALAVLALATVALAAPASAVVAPVDLATSGSYSVLGGQTVTNTGPSRLSGDLGVDPGTAITGFPPGLSAGATHAADAVALQAESDLTIAYDDAAGRAPDGSVAGDLVGQTKVAGVYNSTGPLALSGTLTLDGQGDPSSVFIFQVASTLITASSSYINMINGAQACNVFWQIGSSATLGTHSVFRGTIMALTSISVKTGTVVQGRALARNGQVSLDDNTFTSAACGTTTPATATTTSLTTSTPQVTAGTMATLTAAVASTAPVGTGSVTFTEGSTEVGTVAVGPTGQAVLQLPAGTTIGARSFSAHFNGSVTTAPSASNVTALMVAVAAAAVPVPVAVTATPVASGTTLANTGTEHIMGLTGAGVLLLIFGTIITRGATKRRRALHRA